MKFYFKKVSIYLMHYYLGILFNTRKTIQRIDTGEVNHKKWIPCFIAAIAGAFPIIQRAEITLGSSFAGIISYVVFIPIFYFIILYIMPLFFYFIILYIMPLFWYAMSKLFEGAANFDQLQTIVSLMFIPEIVLILHQFLRAILLSTFELPPPHPILSIVIHLFAFKILIVGLAHYNKFSYHKAFACILLATFPLTLIYAWVKL